MAERVKRYKSFATRWDADLLNEACLRMDPPAFDGSVDWKPELAYDKWIWSLSDHEKEELHSWIVSCAGQIRNSL